MATLFFSWQWQLWICITVTCNCSLNSKIYSILLEWAEAASHPSHVSSHCSAYTLLYNSGPDLLVHINAFSLTIILEAFRSVLKEFDWQPMWKWHFRKVVSSRLKNNCSFSSTRWMILEEQWWNVTYISSQNIILFFGWRKLFFFFFYGFLQCRYQFLKWAKLTIMMKCVCKYL